MSCTNTNLLLFFVFFFKSKYIECAESCSLSQEYKLIGSLQCVHRRSSASDCSNNCNAVADCKENAVLRNPPVRFCFFQEKRLLLFTVKYVERHLLTHHRYFCSSDILAPSSRIRQKMTHLLDGFIAAIL